MKAENKILRDNLGKKRIILNDEQRMYLAVLGRKLGRKVLSDICCAFSPDTLMRWHRDLIAKKYDGSARRGLGRPRLSKTLERLILKVAKHNRHWGYTRIVGQLKYLGFKVSHQTIGNVIKKYGLQPSPDRPKNTTWNEFIRSHWESLAAIDFFTKEVHTIKGLRRYMVLVAIEYPTRKVQIVGIVEQAYCGWMEQMARNLSDLFVGFLKDKRYLVHDRDTLFTKTFRRILKTSGIKTVRTTPMSPNLSPMVERFIRSIKAECLNKMLIFGESHLRYVVSSYIDHYHQERPHQGIGNKIIDPPPQGQGEIVCHERLGGLLKSYRRAA